MKIFRIGSCRIFNIPNEFYGGIQFNNQPIGFTHSTKEHIQFIKYLRGQLQIPREYFKYIYTFFGGKQKISDISERIVANRLALEEANYYLIEISTNKVIDYNGIYFQLSRFLNYDKWGIEKPRDELLSNCHHYTQTEDELKSDFDELHDLLNRKPLIFTGHINALTENKTLIDSRQKLNINIKSLCQTYGHYYYAVTEEFSGNQESYVAIDLLHLTKKGLYLSRDKIITLITGKPISKTGRIYLSLQPIPSLISSNIIKSRNKSIFYYKQAKRKWSKLIRKFPLYPNLPPKN